MQSIARHVPGKELPVPETVSPELQERIAAPLRAGWDEQWATGEEWRRSAEALAAKAIAGLPAMRERLGVSITPGEMDGVRVFTLTPEHVEGSRQGKVLINPHGGCYVLSPGEAGTVEATLMAGIGGYTVIEVDYRMPPEAYFPAALEDTMAVYRAVLRGRDAGAIGFVGTSAGGALVLAAMLQARAEGLPFPGAIAPGTPMSDVTGAGDSFATHAMVDNVLVSPEGFCHAATMVYARGHRLEDPLLSPVYGEMEGFPPTILTTGTRDLLLSNTVRVHRKLRRAGVVAELHVFEGMSHAQYGVDDRIPENREAFGEIASFFDRHLG